MQDRTAIAAVEAWHAAPRRWGNPLHNLCSYMATFPPAIPHVFIEWLTRPGDTVYDPFSGRGTTALEANLMGRRGYCSDLNPLAVLLSGAKVDPPSWTMLSRRLDEIEELIEPESTEAEQEVIRTIFSQTTLSELLWLRKNLDRTNKADRFILATMAGILHLNADASGRPKGLTVAMPNTFSMAPNYVQKYVANHGLEAPETHVLDAVRRRVERFRPLRLPSRGRCWSEDAAGNGQGREWRGKARLVFTSPPYLHLMKYGKFNWLRLWMMGEERQAVDSALVSTASLDRYLDFMSLVLRHMSRHVRPDGYLCLVIGDVADGDKTIRLAEHVNQYCANESGLRPLATLVDHLPHVHKVSRIWSEKKGHATRTDRILVLGGPEVDFLPPLPSFTWDDLGA
jgi:hypothetical protein